MRNFWNNKKKILNKKQTQATKLETLLNKVIFTARNFWNKNKKILNIKQTQEAKLETLYQRVQIAQLMVRTH